MRLLNAAVHNFGSYSHLEFDFSHTGLSLVYGNTGSGKSTIADIPCWILFGVTAKGGGVDEVRSWQTPEEPTKGTLTVELPDSVVRIHRTRGAASQNDLYWCEGELSPSDGGNYWGEPTRGKNMADTQKLIEKRLGVSAELYLIGAYFHEFSVTGAFFTASAKARRAVLEQVASMELAVKLGASTSEMRKITKAELSAAEIMKAKAEGRCEQLQSALESAEDYCLEWERRKDSRIAELKLSADNFENLKASKLEALKTKRDNFQKQQDKTIDELVTQLERALTAKEKAQCSKCGSVEGKLQDRVSALQLKLSRESERENPYVAELAAIEKEANDFKKLAEEEQQKENPFSAQLKKIKSDIKPAHAALAATIATAHMLEARIVSLSILYELSYTLRGELLKRTVQEIEISTNNYLEKYFDSEIRVTFSFEGSDELNVAIQKSGYDCAYTQLSKGQRGLLRLAFVVSVMRAAANSAGVHFNNLYFDEALDGLDNELKVKAFSMFQELEDEHESILLIDHASEFQNLFANRYQVKLVDDTSQVELENE